MWKCGTSIHLSQAFLKRIMLRGGSRGSGPWVEDREVGGGGGRWKEVGVEGS